MIDQTLIFESGFTGHRGEYVRHLMDCINNNPDMTSNFSFLLNSKIEERISDLRYSINYKIHFVNFEIKQNNSIIRSFNEWKIISKVLRENRSINKIIFLDIDPYLILLITKRLSIDVSGIQFRPYIDFKGKSNSIVFNIKNVYKSYLFHKLSVALNKNLKKIFILNNKLGVKKLNKEIGNVFYFLPDPINSNIVQEDDSLKRLYQKKYRMTFGKKILLLFGQIDDRKNLKNIILAISALPEHLRDNLHFVIAGRFNKDGKDEYLKFIKLYEDKFSISYFDDFISDNEMEYLFQISEIVLMPYVNFFSSSGILGHAIKYNKKVIVSKHSLAIELIEEYGCGIAVDPYAPTDIGRGITELLFKSQETSINLDFLSDHSPQKFGKTLLFEINQTL